MTIIGFVTRVRGRIPLVEQEINTLPEHLRFLVRFVFLEL
jgi:hypothetical protein